MCRHVYACHTGVAQSPDATTLEAADLVRAQGLQLAASVELAPQLSVAKRNEQSSRQARLPPTICQSVFGERRTSCPSQAPPTEPAKQPVPMLSRQPAREHAQVVLA